MSVIIFLAVLAVLVLVHEFGHFIFAKKSGIRVDEFGLGFPPRVWSKKVGETVYSVNAIPFGGFVKIFGENPDEESINGIDSARSFVNKNRGIQVLVLSAGVLMNVIFAWILISLGFMMGLPVPLDKYENSPNIKDARLVITSVLENSPASKADLKVGDHILLMETQNRSLKDPIPSLAREFISSNGGKEISVFYKRGDQTGVTKMIPEEGVVSGKSAVGISMDMIGNISLPIHKALIEGGKTTAGLTLGVALGLWDFISGIFSGNADFSQVTGPVGIASMVSDVTDLGLVYLISFTAFISLNLAVINLLPFPALDGGRIIFVIIEAIKGGRINPKYVNALNALGFVFLMVLMVVITFRDITRLF